MKSLIITICIALMLTLSAAAGGHRYISGYLETIGDTFVTVSGEQLNITDETSFLREYKDDGSYYREEIRQRRLRSGDKVRIKALGRDVVEIIEEDY